MLNDTLIMVKLAIFPILAAAVGTLHVDAFAIMCYTTITFGVIYTVIIPKYKRNKKHKQWVKDGCKKEDRYKWEDVQ